MMRAILNPVARHVCYLTQIIQHAVHLGNSSVEMRILLQRRVDLCSSSQVP